MHPIDRRLASRLAARAAAGLDRSPPAVHERAGVSYRVGDRRVIGFCSNDYLGLAADPSLAPAPGAHAPGAAASRLICGDLPEHRALEQRIAEFLGSDDALVLPSGYQLNVGALPALVDPKDHLYSDRLNHASLIDGIRLAPVRPTILDHLQPPALPTPAPTADGPISWWISEGIFSMDGDRSNPGAFREHLAAGGALYVDDAHGLGLFARGLPSVLAAGVRPTVLVATLSKAVGCAGAFVAASRPVCQWLRSHARSHVYTTGMSPLLAANALHRLDLVIGPKGDHLRDRLWRNVRLLADRLGLSEPASPIFPIIVGENRTTLRLGRALLDAGWHVQPIRPPTVPPGTARLRITVSAGHEPPQIEAFARALLAAIHDLGLPPPPASPRPPERPSSAAPVP